MHAPYNAYKTHFIQELLSANKQLKLSNGSVRIDGFLVCQDVYMKCCPCWKNVTELHCYKLENGAYFPDPLHLESSKCKQTQPKDGKNDLLAQSVLCLTFYRIALYSTSSSLISMLAYFVLLPCVFTRNRALPPSVSPLCTFNFKAPWPEIISLVCI